MVLGWECEPATHETYEEAAALLLYGGEHARLAMSCTREGVWRTRGSSWQRKPLFTARGFEGCLDHMSRGSVDDVPAAISARVVALAGALAKRLTDGLER